MNAFIGHSFNEADSPLIQKIVTFIESTGIKCETGERAQNRSIADKVREKISRNDIFIGIFTRDRTLASKIRFFKKKEMIHVTSNWVIQESGFALGKNKELVLMVEDGVYKFPELQGDLELVYFKRDSLEEAYLKVNQMIDSIRARIASETKETLTGKKETEPEKREDEKPEEISKEEIEEKDQDAYDKLNKALFQDRNYKKAQEIYAKDIEPTLEEERKPLIKAIVLRYSHGVGDKSALDQLKALVEANKNRPSVRLELAKRYKDMREYQKSKEEFLIAKDFYDINKESERQSIVNCYKNAGECLALDGKYDEAYGLLSEILDKEELKQYRSKILSALARISDISNNQEKFIVYAEGALDLDPSDTSLRFDLAYKHSEHKNSNLSLLHYKKLTDSIISPMGLNNLGVEYQALGISAKSIESLKKAEEENSTLAMANLAQRYLNEGFIEEAKAKTEAANKLSEKGIEVSGNIGSAITRLERISTEEDEKEKEILLKAEKEKEFFVRYSEAFYINKKIIKENFEGVWQSRWGSFNLRFNEEKNIFEVDDEIKLNLEVGEGFVKLTTEPPEMHFKKRHILIKGSTINMSGKYEINVRDKIEYQYIPADTKEVHKAIGYLIINTNYKTFEIMEKGKDNNFSLLTWTKKD